MSKVTFSKMESISGLWHDDQSCEVLVDGESVGELIKHVVDVGGSIHEYRAGSYEVRFFGIDDKDREFSVPKGGDARATLKAAKSYAKQVLTV